MPITINGSGTVTGISAGGLPDDCIVTADIADNNVTTAKIDNISVTEIKIADDNVTTLKLASNSVTTAKIASNSVTTAKIADNNVTTSKLASNSVTTAKIADNNVTTAKIDNISVTEIKIADNNVTTSKLASNSVTTSKLASNSVTTAKIADNNVTTAKIADGAITQAKRSEQLTLGTTETATGTSVDFTDIPSWVKRITVMLAGVSTNGTSNYAIQIGDSGGIETSGYVSNNSDFNGTAASTSSFLLTRVLAAANLASGIIEICNISGNTWVESGQLSYSTIVSGSAGTKTLSATLDTVRITTVNGTDTFDAGSINIMYE